MLTGVSQAQAPTAQIETPVTHIHFDTLDWRDLMTPNMKKVIQCESGMNPDAIGDSGNSYGVLQIHLPSHPDVTKEEALDPWFAVKWSLKQNPILWTCARKLSIRTW